MRDRGGVAADVADMPTRDGLEVGVKGGDKAVKFLTKIAHKLGGKQFVRVGFLDNAKYPAGDTSRFFKGLAKFTGHAALANQPPKPTVGLPVAQVAFWNEFGTSTIPARSFFRNMIQAKSPKWGEQMAKVLKASEYDTTLTMQRMGEGIKGQLVESIVKWPADNADLTVAIKGFNKGLIDTGVMQRAVDYEVTK